MKLLPKTGCDLTPVIIFFVLCFSFAGAQENNDSTVSSIISNLDKIWEYHNPKIIADLSFSDLNDSTKPDPFKLKSADNTNIKLNELMVKAKEKEKEIYRKTTGLELTGNYLENFKQPFYDTNDGVVFRRRAQLGIEWKVFDNGWYENRIKAKQADYEMKALKMAMMKAMRAKNFNQVKSTIFYSFNKQKNALLAERKTLSEKHLTEAEKLFQLKQLTKEEFLKVQQNKTDISSQQSVYQDYNTVIESAMTGGMQELFLPLVDIDLLKVFAASSLPVNDSSWFYLVKKQELEYNRLRDFDFRTLIRYNYFDLYNPAITNRSFVSMGFSFGVPLQLTRHSKTQLLAIQKDLIKMQGTQQSNELNYIILNLSYEYRYKLKQYLNLLQKRANFYELVRIERVKHEFNDVEFNPSVALLLLDDIYKIDLELIDLKQDMYRHLLEISDKLPDMDINNVIKPVNLIDKHPAIKAVYIWSSSLDSLGGDFINEYCQLNGFNRMIISVRPEKSYMKKVNALISKTGADVEIMIGRNKLLSEGNYLAYFDSVKSFVDMKKVKSLHLDIEPHTIDGFKDNKDELFSKYKNLLNVASEFTRQNKIQLSVSIPLSYPDDVLKKIDSLCDQIYLMAYENTDEEFIFRKSAEERKIDLKRLVIAQRTKDFSNRMELNTKIKKLIEKLGIKNYAIHDIDDLVKMDGKMIGNKKKNE